MTSDEQQNYYKHDIILNSENFRTFSESQIFKELISTNLIYSALKYYLNFQEQVSKNIPIPNNLQDSFNKINNLITKKEIFILSSNLNGDNNNGNYVEMFWNLDFFWEALKFLSIISHTLYDTPRTPPLILYVSKFNLNAIGRFIGIKKTNSNKEWTGISQIGNNLYFASKHGPLLFSKDSSLEINLSSILYTSLNPQDLTVYSNKNKEPDVGFAHKSIILHKIYNLPPPSAITRDHLNHLKNIIAKIIHSKKITHLISLYKYIIGEEKFNPSYPSSKKRDISYKLPEKKYIEQINDIILKIQNLKLTFNINEVDKVMTYKEYIESLIFEFNKIITNKESKLDIPEYDEVNYDFILSELQIVLDSMTDDHLKVNDVYTSFVNSINHLLQQFLNLSSYIVKESTSCIYSSEATNNKQEMSSIGIKKILLLNELLIRLKTLIGHKIILANNAHLKIAYFKSKTLLPGKKPVYLDESLDLESLLKKGKTYDMIDSEFGYFLKRAYVQILIRRAKKNPDDIANMNNMDEFDKLSIAEKLEYLKNINALSEIFEADIIEKEKEIIVSKETFVEVDKTQNQFNSFLNTIYERYSNNIVGVKENHDIVSYSDFIKKNLEDKIKIVNSLNLIQKITVQVEKLIYSDELVLVIGENIKSLYNLMVKNDNDIDISKIDLSKDESYSITSKAKINEYIQLFINMIDAVINNVNTNQDKSNPEASTKTIKTLEDIKKQLVTQGTEQLKKHVGIMRRLFLLQALSVQDKNKSLQEYINSTMKKLEPVNSLDQLLNNPDITFDFKCDEYKRLEDYMNNTSYNYALNNCKLILENSFYYLTKELRLSDNQKSKDDIQEYINFDPKEIDNIEVFKTSKNKKNVIEVISSILQMVFNETIKRVDKGMLSAIKEIQHQRTRRNQAESRANEYEMHAKNLQGKIKKLLDLIGSFSIPNVMVSDVVTIADITKEIPDIKYPTKEPLKLLYYVDRPDIIVDKHIKKMDNPISNISNITNVYIEYKKESHYELNNLYNLFNHALLIDNNNVKTPLLTENDHFIVFDFDFIGIILIFEKNNDDTYNYFICIKNYLIYGLMEYTGYHYVIYNVIENCLKTLFIPQKIMFKQNIVFPINTINNINELVTNVINMVLEKKYNKIFSNGVYMTIIMLLFGLKFINFEENTNNIVKVDDFFFAVYNKINKISQEFLEEFGLIISLHINILASYIQNLSFEKILSNLPSDNPKSYICGVLYFVYNLWHILSYNIISSLLNSFDPTNHPKKLRGSNNILTLMKNYDSNTSTENTSINVLPLTVKYYIDNKKQYNEENANKKTIQLKYGFLLDNYSSIGDCFVISNYPKSPDNFINYMVVTEVFKVSISFTKDTYFCIFDISNKECGLFNSSHNWIVKTYQFDSLPYYSLIHNMIVEICEIFCLNLNYILCMMKNTNNIVLSDIILFYNLITGILIYCPNPVYHSSNLIKTELTKTLINAYTKNFGDHNLYSSVSQFLDYNNTDYKINPFNITNETEWVKAHTIIIEKIPVIKCYNIEKFKKLKFITDIHTSEFVGEFVGDNNISNSNKNEVEMFYLFILFLYKYNLVPFDFKLTLKELNTFLKNLEDKKKTISHLLLTIINYKDTELKVDSIRRDEFANKYFGFDLTNTSNTGTSIIMLVGILERCFNIFNISENINTQKNKKITDNITQNNSCFLYFLKFKNLGFLNPDNILTRFISLVINIITLNNRIIFPTSNYNMGIISECNKIEPNTNIYHIRLVLFYIYTLLLGVKIISNEFSYHLLCQNLINTLGPNLTTKLDKLEKNKIITPISIKVPNNQIIISNDNFLDLNHNSETDITKGINYINKIKEIIPPIYFTLFSLLVFNKKGNVFETEYLSTFVKKETDYNDIDVYSFIEYNINKSSTFFNYNLIRLVFDIQNVQQDNKLHRIEYKITDDKEITLFGYKNDNYWQILYENGLDVNAGYLWPTIKVDISNYATDPSYKKDDLVYLYSLSNTIFKGFYLLFIGKQPILDIDNFNNIFIISNSGVICTVLSNPFRSLPVTKDQQLDFIKNHNYYSNNVFDLVLKQLSDGIAIPKQDYPTMYNNNVNVFYGIDLTDPLHKVNPKITVVELTVSEIKMNRDSLIVKTQTQASYNIDKRSIFPQISIINKDTNLKFSYNTSLGETEFVDPCSCHKINEELLTKLESKNSIPHPKAIKFLVNLLENAKKASTAASVHSECYDPKDYKMSIPISERIGGKKIIGNVLMNSEFALTEWSDTHIYQLSNQNNFINLVLGFEGNFKGIDLNIEPFIFTINKNDKFDNIYVQLVEKLSNKSTVFKDNIAVNKNNNSLLVDLLLSSSFLNNKNEIISIIRKHDRIVFVTIDYADINNPTIKELYISRSIKIKGMGYNNNYSRIINIKNPIKGGAAPAVPPLDYNNFSQHTNFNMEDFCKQKKIDINKLSFEVSIDDFFNDFEKDTNDINNKLNKLINQYKPVDKLKSRDFQFDKLIKYYKGILNYSVVNLSVFSNLISSLRVLKTIINYNAFKLINHPREFNNLSEFRCGEYLVTKIDPENSVIGTYHYLEFNKVIYTDNGGLLGNNLEKIYISVSLESNEINFSFEEKAGFISVNIDSNIQTLLNSLTKDAIIKLGEQSELLSLGNVSGFKNLIGYNKKLLNNYYTIFFANLLDMNFNIHPLYVIMILANKFNPKFSQTNSPLPKIADFVNDIYIILTKILENTPIKLHPYHDILNKYGNNSNEKNILECISDEIDIANRYSRAVMTAYDIKNRELSKFLKTTEQFIGYFLLLEIHRLYLYLILSFNFAKINQYIFLNSKESFIFKNTQNRFNLFIMEFIKEIISKKELNSTALTSVFIIKNSIIDNLIGCVDFVFKITKMIEGVSNSDRHKSISCSKLPLYNIESMNIKLTRS